MRRIILVGMVIFVSWVTDAAASDDADEPPGIDHRMLPYNYAVIDKKREAPKSTVLNSCPQTVSVNAVTVGEFSSVGDINLIAVQSAPVVINCGF